MVKRGRPIKPDAKRDGMNIRLSSDENKMLWEIAEKTGKTRTDVLVDGLRREYERINRD